MKKMTTLLLAVLFCLTSIFALASCDLQEAIDNADYTEDFSSDEKGGCSQLINSFFEETVKDPDFVATCKSKNGEVQFTETVKGTSSHIVYADGTESFAYKKGDVFYWASISKTEDEDGEVSESRYYYCSDPTKDSYMDGMEAVYNSNYCAFMGKYYGVNIVNSLPEENGTFSCATHGERTNGVTTGSLTFDYSTANGTLKITAASEDDKVKTVTIEINDLTNPNGASSIIYTIEQGAPAIELPDTDAWDREEAEAAERIEANERAISDRDEFFDPIYWESNVVVTVKGPTTKLVETIVDDYDSVDYGSYKTYTYIKDTDDENTETYYVFDSEEAKYYMINSDYFELGRSVWFNFIDIYDELANNAASGAEMTCNVDGDNMTYIVKVKGQTVLTVTVTKENDSIVSAKATASAESGEAVVEFSFEYGTGVIFEPDITDFDDATPTEELE